MLYTRKYQDIFIQRFFTFLFFISFITFQNHAFADSKEDIAENYRELGYAAQQKGNLYEALTNYNKAIALGNENPVVLNDIGILHEQIGMPEKARGYYLKALSIDKDYLPTYMNLAFFYQNQGDKESAFKYFKQRYEYGDPSDRWTKLAKEELLKIHPEYQVWITRREAEKLNEVLTKQAQKEFEEKVKKAQEHYQQGLDFAAQDELNKALVEFNLAMSLTPDNPKIIKAKEDVKRKLTAQRIQEQADLAIKRINAGDSYSAQYEIQKMLSTIPDETKKNPRR